ncbi:unnamed protein product [Sphagnum balticum]
MHRAHATLQEAYAAAYNQQKTHVIDLIKHWQTRLPFVTGPQIAHKGALVALDDMRAFVDEHPDRLACVIDTLNACLDEQCVHLEFRIRSCMTECQQERVSLEDAELLQHKLNNLVRSYHLFQLTRLGKLDYCLQDFLQKHPVGTYVDIAKPWLSYLAISNFLGYSIDFLNSVIPAHQPKSESVLKELNSSLVKAVAAGFFTPEISTSIAKIHRYTKEFFSQEYAYMVGNPHKSTYPTKVSKESFDTIKGYQQTKVLLMPLVHFCTNLIEYRGTDLKMARGYLFEGNLNDGRKIACALAGQITKNLQLMNSPTVWHTHEIHASALVSKKLDKTIDDCLEFGPTVLIIKDIDWIYQQKDVDLEIYADIINKLGKYVSAESNVPLVVCATTHDHCVIDPVMLEAVKFELIRLS